MLIGKENFVAIYCDCSLEVCEKRDAKGLYAKARRGEITDFTGISAPYEAPENPEIHLKTDLMSLKECVDIVTNYLLERKAIVPLISSVSKTISVSSQEQVEIEKEKNDVKW